jgi:protein-arginine kinase activator protein McsA
MHNPTRMSVIEKAGAKMVNLLEQACPSCNTPGFDVIKVLDGLPCSQCGSPTQSIAALIFGCQACGKTLEKRYPKGKTHEDPMYCNWCNP